jgi:hypothetical protein
MSLIRAQFDTVHYTTNYKKINETRFSQKIDERGGLATIIWNSKSNQPCHCHCQLETLFHNSTFTLRWLLPRVLSITEQSNSILSGNPIWACLTWGVRWPEEKEEIRERWRVWRIALLFENSWWVVWANFIGEEGDILLWSLRGRWWEIERRGGKPDPLMISSQMTVRNIVVNEMAETDGYDVARAKKMVCLPTQIQLSQFFEWFYKRNMIST